MCCLHICIKCSFAALFRSVSFAICCFPPCKDNAEWTQPRILAHKRRNKEGAESTAASAIAYKCTCMYICVYIYIYKSFGLAALAHRPWSSIKGLCLKRSKEPLSPPTLLQQSKTKEQNMQPTAEPTPCKKNGKHLHAPWQMAKRTLYKTNNRKARRPASATE